MSVIKLSPEGEALVAQTPEIQAILDEFGMEEAEAPKSYRGEVLGSGSQAIVYATQDDCLAEKVWHGKPREDRPHDGVTRTFDRHLQIRSHWAQNRPEASRLYIPAYYASVEHPDTRGAILQERIGTGIPISVALLEAARNFRPGGRVRVGLAVSLGIEEDRLAEVADDVEAALDQEDPFHASLFEILPLPDNDYRQGHNLLIDYDPTLVGSAAVRRIIAIDL